ncbi:non-heme iron oxygenase ferredoxin subunit [Achromobacter aegrifaciens]|uniref:non-heme iron oxygenase ferredoxin subunit n=1 Tax=Achromobacter aegrifaciens TaxID=1287736 RepID=UPI0028AE1809|nr:non-heme iron oxygenase ferredoxin subunit [Achromobacter aegrifaciens]
MNWIRIASTDQLTEDDEVIPVVAGEKQLALYRVEGEFHASDNVCTHAYALLSDGYLEDGCIECPLHQAKFDIRTGRAMCAPATTGIRIYPVKVEGQDIYANLQG